MTKKNLEFYTERFIKGSDGVLFNGNNEIESDNEDNVRALIVKNDNVYSLLLFFIFYFLINAKIRF